jgi:hypothetical protein
MSRSSQDSFLLTRAVRKCRGQQREQRGGFDEPAHRIAAGRAEGREGEAGRGGGEPESGEHQTDPGGAPAAVRGQLGHADVHRADEAGVGEQDGQGEREEHRVAHEGQTRPELGPYWDS